MLRRFSGKSQPASRSSLQQAVDLPVADRRSLCMSKTVYVRSRDRLVYGAFLVRLEGFEPPAF